MVKIKARDPNVTRRLLTALGVIAMGLLLRLTGYEVGLQYFLVKYGGSLLWGMMVFWLVALVLPGLPVRRIGLIAMESAILVEMIRLYHTPWLDAVRDQFLGGLLLGRIFSWWNIVAYGVAILLAALIESRMLNRQRVRAI